MSLSSWKKEYYPIPASRCSKKNALDHSIRKWTGLLKVNLKKHGLRADAGELLDGKHTTGFGIDCESCALCHYYMDIRMNCGACPLALANKGVPCDGHYWDDDHSTLLGQYSRFLQFDNARPMLNLLKKAKRMLDGVK